MTKRCTELLIFSLLVGRHSVMIGQDTGINRTRNENDEHQRERVIIDRVIAVVGDHVLTARDLQLEIAITDRLPGPVPFIWNQAPNPQQALVDQALIRERAGEITLYRPSASEVRSRLYQFRSTWSDPRDFERFVETHQISEERLESIFFSRMVAESYVRRHVMLPHGRDGNEPSIEVTYTEWIDIVREDPGWRIVPPTSPE